MEIDINKTIKKLANEHPYTFDDIKKLKTDCKLNDEQLEKVIIIAREGGISLNDASSVLLGFKQYLQNE